MNEFKVGDIVDFNTCDGEYTGCTIKYISHQHLVVEIRKFYITEECFDLEGIGNMTIHRSEVYKATEEMYGDVPAKFKACMEWNKLVEDVCEHLAKEGWRK